MRIAAFIIAFFIASFVKAEPLLLAGGNEMFLVDSNAAAAGKIEKLWRWSGADAKDLPDGERKAFEHLDECKPAEGGTKILICASNGGCALLDRTTQRLLWRAHVTNAHSLTLLPKNRIVVASSLSGDQLVLFDLNSAAPDKPIFKTPLHSAHGVVWDEERHCLWSLNFDELRSYDLEQWDADHPALKLRHSYPLPNQDGHDLLAVPSSKDLLLTTEKSVQLFDRDQGTFRPHPELGSVAGIKSVSIYPKTGQLVWSEWKATVHLLSPNGQITFPGAHPYKARWLVEAGR